MSSFGKHFAIIPVPAKIVAAAVAVLFSVLIILVAPAHDPEMKDVPLWALVVLGILGALMCGSLVLLDGYVYGDAKRRGMRAVLWLLLAIFIPNLIGVILYSILRSPL
ncbi:MAG: hypothetical protein GY953_31460, partial [bacterium]|nr:hypothetical protein [bacterium]